MLTVLYRFIAALFLHFMKIQFLPFYFIFFYFYTSNDEFFDRSKDGNFCFSFQQESVLVTRSVLEAPTTIIAFGLSDKKNNLILEVSRL